MTQRLIQRRPEDPEPRGNWRERGACVNGDPELFFPIGVGRRAEEQAAAAKRICQRCPVIVPCLDWALLNGHAGIWGGLDCSERRALRHPSGLVTADAEPTWAEPDDSRMLPR